MKLGAIVVQVNPLYTAAEMEFILEDSGAKMIFCDNTAFLTLNKNNSERPPPGKGGFIRAAERN